MIWKELLIDPSTQEKIIIDWENKCINNIDTHKFTARLEANLPIILPKKLDHSFQSSELHRQSNSEFDYLDHYQKDAEVFDYFQVYESPISNEEIHRLHQSILKVIPKNAQLILDVGCGNAWLSQALVNSERSVISMDISITNPRKALENLNHPNHFGLVADVFHLPIAENSVDCIVASEIIEHVAQPKLLIEKLMKPLKKGGKLIITTPYNETIVHHLCVHCNHLTPSNAHLHSFNEYTIKALIPPEIASWQSCFFAHKYMAKTRLYLMMKSMPFSLWQSVDSLANKLMKSPTRLMMELIK